MGKKVITGSRYSPTVGEMRYIAPNVPTAVRYGSALPILLPDIDAATQKLPSIPAPAYKSSRLIDAKVQSSLKGTPMKWASWCVPKALGLLMSVGYKMYSTPDTRRTEFDTGRPAVMPILIGK